MEFLRAGFDLLCSDLDVVWLRDPRPFVMHGEAGTMLLPLADVVVSTDVTHGGNDHDEAVWGLQGELNTGIILLRSTLAALALCDEWIRRMQYEMVHKPPPSGGFLQWWVPPPTGSAQYPSRRRVVPSPPLPKHVHTQRSIGMAMGHARLATGHTRPALRRMTA